MRVEALDTEPGPGPSPTGPAGQGIREQLATLGPDAPAACFTAFVSASRTTRYPARSTPSGSAPGCTVATMRPPRTPKYRLVVSAAGRCSPAKRSGPSAGGRPWSAPRPWPRGSWRPRRRCRSPCPTACGTGPAAAGRCLAPARQGDPPRHARRSPPAPWRTRCRCRARRWPAAATGLRRECRRRALWRKGHRAWFSRVGPRVPPRMDRRYVRNSDRSQTRHDQPPGGIGAGSDHTPRFGPPANGKRFAGQAGVPLFFNGAKKSVQIEMQNLARHQNVSYGSVEDWKTGKLGAWKLACYSNLPTSHSSSLPVFL